MTGGRNVVVKQLPAVLDGTVSDAFYRELAECLQTDKPCLVLDFSEVRQIDSSGVDLLLRSIEETMKRNGDVKLAAVRPEAAAVLSMTRVDRLFEIFEKCSDAAESFFRFSPASPSATTDHLPEDHTFSK